MNSNNGSSKPAVITPLAKDIEMAGFGALNGLGATRERSIAATVAGS
jgi:hypothetical protein